MKKVNFQYRFWYKSFLKIFKIFKFLGQTRKTLEALFLVFDVEWKGFINCRLSWISFQLLVDFTNIFKNFHSISNIPLSKLFLSFYLNGLKSLICAATRQNSGDAADNLLVVNVLRRRYNSLLIPFLWLKVVFESWGVDGVLGLLSAFLWVDEHKYRLLLMFFVLRATDFSRTKC